MLPTKFWARLMIVAISDCYSSNNRKIHHATDNNPIVPTIYEHASMIQNRSGQNDKSQAWRDWEGSANHHSYDIVVKQQIKQKAMSVINYIHQMTDKIKRVTIKI